MASFPQASPPTPCAPLYPHPYAPHALPISFVSCVQKLLIKMTKNLKKYIYIFFFTILNYFIIHFQQISVSIFLLSSVQMEYRSLVWLVFMVLWISWVLRIQKRVNENLDKQLSDCRATKPFQCQALGWHRPIILNIWILSIFFIYYLFSNRCTRELL